VDPSGKEVFEILVQGHANMLRAFLLSVVRRPQDADDLFQETLAGAWRGLGRYDRDKPFGPWLRGIAMNLVSDWRQSERRRTLLLCDGPTLERIEERYLRLERDDRDTWQERTEALQGCLGQLESEDRRILELRYRGGRSCESIGGELQRGVEWVKKRLQRARSALALCVEGRLSESGGAP